MYNRGMYSTVRKDNSVPAASVEGMIEQVVPHFGYPIYNLFFTEYEILREGWSEDLWVQYFYWKYYAVYLQIQSASANLR